MKSTSALVTVAVAALIAGSVLVLVDVASSRGGRDESSIDDYDDDDSSSPRGSLPTNSVLWVHSEGHLCLHANDNAIQFWNHAEADVIVVQEIIGNQMYTYERVNTDFLYQQAQATGSGSIEGVDTSWIDALVDLKYNCVVENLDEHVDLTATLLEQQDSHDKGSTWQVGHWHVQADNNLVPRSLSTSPDETDEDDDNDDFVLTITRVDTCHIPILGCDPLKEAGDDHVPYDGPSELAWQALFDEAQVEAPVGHGHERFLGAWQDIQNGLSGTKWCGQGTPKDNPCPGDPTVAEQIFGYDYDADRACRRHDHGRKYKVLTGFVRTECMNDRDLVLAAGGNLAINAVYGKFGISATFGCYGFGNYKCWKNWRYRCQCRGERIRYGTGRYTNNERHPEWGYYSPADPSVEGGKLCADDLWQCEGPTRDDPCNEILDPKDEEGTC